MRWINLLFLALLLACTQKKTIETPGQKFNNSIINVRKIGTLKKLTNDGRSIYPIFSPVDSIVFFQRLLITNSADTFAYFQEELTKPYGVNTLNNNLYTLEGTYEFSRPKEINVDSLPRRFNERTVWGIRSPENTTFAFETIFSTENGPHVIYLAKGDSIRQLTFVLTTCYLERDRKSVV
jgi:hypothetical protein